MTLIKILVCFLVFAHLNDGQRTGKKEKGNMKASYVPQSAFSLYVEGGSAKHTCTLQPYVPQTLQFCGFNTSNPLVVIIHGWTVDGYMESWVLEMAAALKSALKDVNVVICDWLTLAHRHYSTAAQNARIAGQDVAHLLQWLVASFQFPTDKVHLIGYCMGAHVSGFAGSYFTGSKKIGRITGLDPTGPLFEGMTHTERLSPEDAKFVDAIHTFTQQRMGLSMGILQPVGHFDFYPNGGASQPGCKISTLFSHLSQYGLGGHEIASWKSCRRIVRLKGSPHILRTRQCSLSSGIDRFQKSVKCSHERAVQLFIDSLLNRDKQSTGFWCKDETAFDQGACLDCRKNRCNRLGYDIKRVQTKTSKKLYLNTRGEQPFKVYHYQLKLQFINQVESIKPSLTMSLRGSRGESAKTPLTFVDGIDGNKTHTFLVTLDADIGDLMMLKLHWEGKAVLASVWNAMQTYIPWGTGGKRPGISVGDIRIKTGDTQAKVSFCGRTNDEMNLQPSQEKVFVRCNVGRRKQQKKRTRG